MRRRPMNRRRAAQPHKGLPPDVFARIVEAVPMQAAAERYGLRPDRHGMCCCPFHSEKTPSFKIYPGSGGFYCFGCGVGGDVITFAEKLHGLSAVEAARRLDADFGLGLFREEAPPPDNTWQQRQHARQAREARREALLWSIARRLREIHRLPVPRPGAHGYAARYALEQANADYLEYLKEEIANEGGAPD